MKRILYTLILIFCSNALTAQKEANNWHFGVYYGLDFSTGCRPGLAPTSSMATMEASAAISDKDGSLLFYSDAVDVWNREHETMPNSGDDNPLEGIFRSYQALSQGALIVPAPADPQHIYYLFSLIESDQPVRGHMRTGKLTYSRIDMRLDGGKGDVIPADKSTFLASGLASRLTAIPHANGTDYWLLTHEYASDAFLVYPITRSGIGPADTLRIGPEIDTRRGFLKASPDGTKLACSSGATEARSFDLYDFDASTGQISNYVSLGMLRVAYGISFSPDNTKLYVSNMNWADRDQPVYYPELIRQYDLQAGSTGAIIASGKSIVYQNPFTNVEQDSDRSRDFYAPSLQLGPDGRIYCAANVGDTSRHDWGYRFLVIEKPNEAGFACDVNVQTLKKPVGFVGHASDLPNFMQHYFNGIESWTCFGENEGCADSEIVLFPNPAREYIELSMSNLCFTKYHLRLINMSGQVLASYPVNEPDLHRVDVSNLSAGIYLVEMRFRNRVAVKRFVRY
ncbi:MAG: hypothetical protein ABS46_19820 [Cytophagaceae bacterium SCN 52-12]|nr:MAG: hypothetical protein ABS46_19820 [Cytophagaceae bacterium SCN 52-12]